MSVNIQSKREQEKETLAYMITYYCHKKHGGNTLCEECCELLNYANERSDKCPFMETKTFCSNCKVHCYKPDMREKVRDVMRYAGVRMLFHKPILALRHVYYEKKEKRGMKK